MSSPSAVAFEYEAARSDGVVVRGLVDAVSGPEAAAVLSARGLFPLAVEPRRAITRGWRSRPSLRAEATFFQAIASLVDAGVPLERALAASTSVAAGTLRDSIARVADRVRQGSSLTASLGAEGMFSPVAIGLVRAGERGVGLASGLLQAATQLEHEAESRARIRAALTYPALLATVGSGSVALIVFYVIPRFAALLGDLGQTLPPATRLLLGATEVLRHYGVLLAIAVVGGAVWVIRHIEQRRAGWHGWLLGLPLIGRIRHAFATSRASRTVAALLATGTPALDALRVAAEAVGDQAIVQRLLQARDRVAEGASLSAALRATNAMTDVALQLAGIGEGSGRLPALLAKAADLEEQGAEGRLKALVGLLEPALIIAFAGLVAFVAAALLQAVYAVRPGGM